MSDACKKGIGICLFLLLGTLVFAFCFYTDKDKENSSDLSAQISSDATNTDAVTDDVVSTSENIDDVSYEALLKDLPAYDAIPYVFLNDNLPLFKEEDITTLCFEYYSELDELGRCGTAYANICVELMPSEERGEIGQIKPTGWHTVKYNDLIEGNYLYNRCHLIAYCLAGENANEKNLITGTRYLNVQGMQLFENQVAEYVKNTGNHVLYRVTPVFFEDNLLASGVTMEALSVEDNGAGVCFFVFVYNVQPGIVIDYATGESDRDAAYVAEDFEKETLEKADYILNKNTKRFHKVDCQSVDEIKEKNKQTFKGDRENLIKMGYKPCGRCNP